MVCSVVDCGSDGGGGVWWSEVCSRKVGMKQSRANVAGELCGLGGECGYLALSMHASEIHDFSSSMQVKLVYVIRILAKMAPLAKKPAKEDTIVFALVDIQDQSVKVCELDI